MTWFWAKDVGTWTPDLQSTCVNRHKLNGQGFSSLLGNGVAVTLLEAPSCLDGCHHGKEWRAPSGHEWNGKAVSKWWQSGRTTVQSLNYGSWLIWLIVVTSFLPIFGRQWRSCVAACCPAGSGGTALRLSGHLSLISFGKPNDETNETNEMTPRRAMNASKAVARFA